jgi:cyclic pyranopterin phosphate synthase
MIEPGVPGSRMDTINAAGRVRDWITAGSEQKPSPRPPLHPRSASLKKTERPLIDGHARPVSYLRLSITDRCDLRCSYCMPEHTVFQPRKDLLTLAELHDLALGLIDRGITKLRLTGGEPLVRKGVVELVERLGRKLGNGLDELTLTTNGTQLASLAGRLANAGVRRINVSLDTLDRELFARLTKRDSLAQVLAGIAAAQAAGLEVKMNVVVLKDLNEHQIPGLIRWAHERGCSVTLIEVMPLGDVEADRFDHFLPLATIRERLGAQWTLMPSDHRSGGPARYFDVVETGGRIGLITPLSHNFCDSCNRIRITATGQLFPCLGGEARVDLRAALRSGRSQDALDEALDEAMRIKPARHHFAITAPGQSPALARHMSATGG